MAVIQLNFMKFNYSKTSKEDDGSEGRTFDKETFGVFFWSFCASSVVADERFINN
jgi:hypothetical protein